MRMASFRYQNRFQLLISLSLICWLSTSTGLSYFESSTPASDFEIMPFSNESEFRIKRDAYETLRDLGGMGGSADDLMPTVVQRRLWNTSWALTIPLFSFKLPHFPDGGFIANQAIYGLFAFIINIIPFGLSFIFTGAAPTTPTTGYRSMVQSAKKSNFDIMGSKFSENIGMDSLQCLQKVVCQAYRSPENRKYGLIASSVRMLFTAPVNVTIDNQMPPLKKAAWDGRHSKENCEKLYDCLLDALGSARYLAHWYRFDKFLLGSNSLN